MKDADAAGAGAGGVSRCGFGSRLDGVLRGVRVSAFTALGVLSSSSRWSNASRLSAVCDLGRFVLEGAFAEADFRLGGALRFDRRSTDTCGARRN